MEELSPVTVKPSPQPSREYLIHFRALSEVPGLLKWAGFRPGICVVITDENVGALHLETVARALGEAGWSVSAVTLPAGEATKSLDHLNRIYDAVLPMAIDRTTPLLALGGGVIGDVAGFAAATLLRGVPLVQLPTTLMAQVDSAIGGKTGINHAAGKNLIGAFHQPVFVCSDLDVLATLPGREWNSGMAEVVKHALIADAELFEYLGRHWERIMMREPRAVGFMVQRSTAIKARIVSEDERESGVRAILNFGHTFGHALEKITGYGRFSHGEAVALGMIAALHLSRLLRPSLDVQDAVRLVQRIPLPRAIADLDKDRLIDAMYFDKKVRAGKIHCVVLDSVGRALVTDSAGRDALDQAWSLAQETINSA